MKITMRTPVILVAIADYGRDHTLHLRGLIPELNEIQKILKQNKACKIRTVLDASIEQIMDAFEEETNPIVGFHFAGHGNGYELAMKESVSGEKFAAYLGSRPDLKWIFLNSCASSTHAKHLIQAGINAVITTSRAIRDEVALEFAKSFYQRLGAFDNLREAFEYYPQKEEMKVDRHPGYYRDREAIPEFVSDPLWELHLREGAEEMKSWNLLKASGNPLLGLPGIPAKFSLPVKPFRSLEWFKREHAEIFFGRGEEILELFKFATADSWQTPVMLLYGQSGVGKSSLLEAGLFPRIEEDYEVIYLRRGAGKNLSSLLSAVIGDSSPSQDLSHQQWQQYEASCQKPLILIFDQLEEVFTHPNPDQEGELNMFLSFIAGIFNRPANRPKGKIILSFRKEYLSEIHRSVRDKEIAHILMAIRPLTKKGIKEAIEGVSTNKRLQTTYQLSIEEGLSEIIADDLMEDSRSSIVPVLQILLTKMWDQAYSKNPSSPFFSTVNYQKIRREGILLEDFVREKFRKIREWKVEPEVSGLLLDLLMYHITELSTSERRTIKAIRERYQHRQDIIDQLLREVRETYLLIDSQDESLDQEPALRLIHDTLGPIIRKEYEQSQRDGQIASRILGSKILEDSQNPGNAVLDNNGLQMVEKGRTGMRIWSEKETQLIEESKAIVASQKRLKKQIRWGAGIAITGILLSLSGFLFQAKKNQLQQEAQILYMKAENILNTAPPQAFEYLKKSYEIMPSAETKEAYYHIATNYIPFQILHEEIEPVVASAQSPNLSKLAIATTHSILLYRIEGSSLVFQDTVDRSGMRNIDLLFPENDRIVWSSDSRHIFHYKISEGITSELPRFESQITSMYLMGENIYFSLEGDSSNYLADLTSNSFQLSLLKKQENNSLFSAPLPYDFGVTGNSKGDLQLIHQYSGKPLLPRLLTGHQTLPNGVAITDGNDRRYLISTATNDQRILLWDLGEIPLLRNKWRRFFENYWALENGWAFSDGETIWITDSLLNETATFELENYQEISCLIPTPDGKGIIYSNTESIYFLDLSSLNINWGKPHSVSGINQMVMVNDKLFWIGKKNQYIHVWNLANGDSLTKLSGHQGNINRLYQFKDKLLSSGRDSLAILWDTKKLASIQTYRHPGPNVVNGIYLESSDIIRTEVNNQKAFYWELLGKPVDIPDTIAYTYTLPLKNGMGYMGYNSRQKTISILTPDGYLTKRIEIADRPDLNQFRACRQNISWVSANGNLYSVILPSFFFD